MSIQSRIKDAEAFWKEDRKQDALLAVLSAANDTARKRYPQASDKERMASFITDAAMQLAGSGTDLFDWSFRGGVALGEVLQDVYRSLLETATLPPDVELAPGSEFQIHVLDGNRRAYSECLIPRLIEVVKRSPENAKEFSRRK
jgi:hypothetical protein